MRTIERSTRFKKDFKCELKGRHKETIQAELASILSKLMNDAPLEIKYCDHALSNNWKGYRDCHIKPDLVLLYRKIEGVLQLIRIGSHSEIGL